jgi:hypothetical protein
MVVDRAAAWVGANPLRTSGGSAALLSGGVILNALNVQLTPEGLTAVRMTPAGLWTFFAAHPAYLVAFVVGLAVFLFVKG